jgi:hypothetical protein
MANLIQTNNANIKIFGGKLSAGVAGGGSGGGGGGSTFFTNWTTLPAVGSPSFGQVTYQGGGAFSINNNNLEIGDRASLTTFNASYTYTNSGTTVDASNCSNLTMLNIPGNGMTALDVSNCTSLSFLDFGYQYTTITNVNLANCPNLVSLFFWGNIINETIVDSILAQLVQNGANAGTVRINQGAISSPSAQGYADKATLESRGWNVYTN